MAVSLVMVGYITFSAEICSFAMEVNALLFSLEVARVGIFSVTTLVEAVF